MRRQAHAIVGVLLALAAFGMFADTAHAQRAVFHGMSLNDGVNHLLIEQIYDTCRIGITSRQREWGPSSEANTGNVANESPRTEVRYLVQTRVRVLKPSAPNYLQNPGYLYRIQVETLELWPPYSATVDVDANDAREALMYQIHKIAMNTPDMKDALALWKASTLILDIYTNTKLMPAEIYKSVLLSRSGLFRIVPNVRQRRAIAPSQLFAPEMQIERPNLGATQKLSEEGRLVRQAAKPFAIGLPDPEERFRSYEGTFSTELSAEERFSNRFTIQNREARTPIYRTGNRDERKEP